jgi:hypothetical protein
MSQSILLSHSAPQTFEQVEVQDPSEQVYDSQLVQLIIVEMQTPLEQE